METDFIRGLLASEADRASGRIMDADLAIAVARRRLRWRRNAAIGLAAAVLAGGGVGLAVAVGDSTSGGQARLVPAAPPTQPPAIEGITTPISLPDEHIRLDPAGAPPASTVTYDQLVRLNPTAFAPDPRTTIRVVYGLFTDADFGSYNQSHKLGVGPITLFFDHKPAVWIIRTKPNPNSANPDAWYTAIDPVTGKGTLAWGPTVPGGDSPDPG
jgi:hypothetical protein